MRKLTKSLKVSAVITGIIVAINWIIFAITSKVLLGISMGGGEMEGTIGIGIYRQIIYPLSNSAEGIKPTMTVHFEPITIILTLVVIFVISMIVLSLRGRGAKK